MLTAKRLAMVSLVALGALLLGAGCQQGAQSKYPEKAISYLVQASAGGSSDIFTRKIAEIATRNKFCPVPIEVVNKEGGSGAVSYTFTAEKKGDPYYIQNAAANFISTPIQNPKVPDYKSFTPIARMAMDQNVIAVNASSPYKTLAELVDHGKKNPKVLKWGGTSVGAPDHVTMILVGKATGSEFNYIAYTAATEVLPNLMGGHLDVATMNASEAIPQAEAGKFRILGIATEQRTKLLPNVPTLKEQGINVVIYVQRGAVAPGEIPVEAQTFLIGMFKKVSETEEWKKYLDSESLGDGWLEGAAYGKFLEEDSSRTRAILTDLGMAKTK